MNEWHKVGRLDYVSSVTQRMTGFSTEGNPNLAPQPQDLEDLPCVARRFLTRAGLITLNSKVKTHNPHCVGEIR